MAAFVSLLRVAVGGSMNEMCRLVVCAFQLCLITVSVEAV